MKVPGSRGVLVLLGLGAMPIGCESSFAPASSLTAVRILAARTDAPYAPPGANVTAEVLAYDGRLDPKGRVMRLYWLVEPCLSPKDDSVGDCYARFQGAYPKDVDLGTRVVEGATAVFRVPEDALSKAPPRPSSVPFASMFLFTAACAGRLRMVGTREGYPDEVPFACFDEAGNRLGAEDFVFGFARSFVYEDRKNANPEAEYVSLDGTKLSSTSTAVIERCTAVKVEQCPAHTLEVYVPDAASEVDPGSVIGKGAPDREQVWATFYANRSKIENEAIVLFDATKGRLVGGKNELRAPSETGDFDLFVVTRDSRSGVSWKSFKLTAK
jgi:hypothetical protein